MLQVCFDCYGTYTTDSVYQWDLNRRLAIRGLDYNSAPAIHFSNKKSTEALVVQSTIEDGVIYCEVPNILLQEPYDIVGYVCECLDQELTTYETIRIPVKPRVKPADYAYENNVEILNYYSLMSEITSVKVSTEKEVKNLDANKASKSELNTVKADLETAHDTDINRVENEIASERARIDQLVASPELGEGDLEKEVGDLRIDIKGTTHDSAGTAVREQILELNSKIDSNVSTLSSEIEGLKDMTTELNYEQVQDSELKIHNGDGQLFIYESSNPKQIALDSSLTFCPYTIGCKVTEGETIKVIGMSFYNSYTGAGVVFSTSENDIPVWSWLNGLPAVDTSLYDVYGGNTEEAWRSFEYDVIVPKGAKMVWVKGQKPTGTKIYKTHSTFKAYSKEESDSLYVKQNESMYEESIYSMRNKPTIIFNFDQSAYDNRVSILKSRGFSATFAVNPTNTEVNKKLVLDGFDLSPYQGLANGSYGTGLERPTDYTNVSAWRNFIGNLIEKCESLGIYKPISYSCYGHKGGPAIDTVCKEFGFKYVRCGALYGADGETVTEYVDARTTPDVYHKYPYPMEMHTVEETKNVIDNTITDGNREMVLMCHLVDGGEGHLSESDFIEIVDYVKEKYDAGLVNVLNFHEYYALWYPNENARDNYCRLLRASMN